MDYLDDLWYDYRNDFRTRTYVNGRIALVLLVILCVCSVSYIYRLSVRYEKSMDATIQEALENQAVIFKDGQEVSEDSICLEWIDKASYNEEKNILYIEYE